MTAMKIGNSMAAAIVTSIPGLNMFGGIPMNMVTNRLASTNISNPLVIYVYALYFDIYSRYGPSITSALVFMIANGYSFINIMNPMK